MRLPEQSVRREIAECLKRKRVVKINGRIQLHHSDHWVERLKQLSDANPGPILIHIVNTEGGNELAILPLNHAVERLREDPNRRIYSLAEGYCRSAGVEALMIGNPMVYTHAKVRKYNSMERLRLKS